MKALITTTINVPNVLTQWAETLAPDDHIIVAGDHKSPHGAIEGLLNEIAMSTGVITRYLTPTDQTRWAVSEHLGWNCVQRRNIALLEAIKLEPDHIITIDDDNAPTSTDQLAILESYFTDSSAIKGVDSSDGWFDGVGEHSYAFNPWGHETNITHRGYPQAFRFSDAVVTDVEDTTKWPIGVAAMFWRGEPDIDAAERFTHRPIVHHVEHEGVKLLPGTWCPFNSQATMYTRELAPLMFVWPGVGRYDDIWASFLARRVMDHLGLAVYYGPPAVNTEVRNDHDVVADLEAELFGMKHNQAVIDVLRNHTDHLRENATIAQLMSGVHGWLESELSHVLPQQTFNAFSAWLGDLQGIGVE